eukprot:scaffold24417_cov81-Isochrysis_galbana.AAC.2
MRPARATGLRAPVPCARQCPRRFQSQAPTLAGTCGCCAPPIPARDARTRRASSVHVHASAAARAALGPARWPWARLGQRGERDARRQPRRRRNRGGGSYVF